MHRRAPGELVRDALKKGKASRPEPVCPARDLV
jgi:hypothetical protein